MRARAAATATVTATAVAWLALGAARGAPLPPAGERWIRADTAHFTLLGNAPEERLRTLAADLERLHATLSELTGRSDLGDSRPTLVHVFRDDAAYTPYKLLRGGKRVEAPGYLVPGEDGHYVALNAHPDVRPTRIVYRQYIHQLLLEEGPPVWLRHGIAELYSTFEVSGGEARIGRPDALNFAMLRAQPWIPLAELLAAVEEPEEAKGPTRSPFAIESGALVHYLFLGRGEEPERQRRFIHRLLDGEPAARALREELGVKLETLDEELIDYAAQGRFPVKRYRLEGEADLAVEVRPLERHEVLYHLGGLLLHAVPERRAEAEEHFRKAVELRPDHGPSWLGLGELAQQAGDEGAALAHYERAVAWAPDDARAQLLHGAALLRSLGDQRPMDEEGAARLEAAKAALRKALERKGDLAEAWVQLGYAWGLSPDTSPEEVEALQNALRLLPERKDLLSNLLLAHARAGDREAVEEVWGRMLAEGSSPETLARAREVRLKMDFIEADRSIRQGESDDAAALFARILAESRDPALLQQAEDRLALLRRVADYNRFAEIYTEASRLLEAGDPETAAPLVEELHRIARPGLQTRAVEALAERLAADADAPH